MKRYITDGKLAIIIVAAILMIDQIIKILIKINMVLDDSIHIADWFCIRLVENDGMAYSMIFFSRLTLSLFGIVAISVIAYYIHKLVECPQLRGYIIYLTIILAGAIGNVTGSILYDLTFSLSVPYDVAELMPSGFGYASLPHGRVVDMFYFPTIETT